MSCHRTPKGAAQSGVLARDPAGTSAFSAGFVARQYLKVYQRAVAVVAAAIFISAGEFADSFLECDIGMSL